jgi:hypothetical protein
MLENLLVFPPPKVRYIFQNISCFIPRRNGKHRHSTWIGIMLEGFASTNSMKGDAFVYVPCTSVPCKCIVIVLSLYSDAWCIFQCMRCACRVCNSDSTIKESSSGMWLLFELTSLILLKSFTLIDDLRISREFSNDVYPVFGVTTPCRNGLYCLHIWGDVTTPQPMLLLNSICLPFGWSESQ